MRRKIKQWTALLLAVLMVSSTCLYSADTFLWAAEGETVPYDAAGEETVAADDTADTDAGIFPAEETGPVTETQEILIPEQLEALEEETVQPEADTEPIQEVPDVSAETEDVPADVSLGQNVEVTSSENVENTYNVTFYRPAVEGGALRVWTEGSAKKDVAYTDGRYTEEVKEGAALYFEIECSGNYFVDQIIDQNGVTVGAESVNGNIFTYKMVINENKEITITYREIPKEDPSEEMKEEVTEEVSEEEEPKEEANKKETAEDKNNEKNLSEAMDKAAQILDNMKSSSSLFSITDANGNTEQVTIAVGETIKLEDNEGSNIAGWNHWTCDDTNIVKVDKNSNNGKQASVTGITAGEAVITHSWGFLGNGSDTNTFRVIVEDVKVSNIRILDAESGEPVDSFSMKTYEEAYLTAGILPENATNKGVSWSSSAPEIVAVENGKIIAQEAGSAIITVTAQDGSGISASVAVKVTDVAVENIQIISTTGSGIVNVDGTLLLKAEILPEDATDQSVVWMSDNEEIAVVDENGLVTGIHEGTVTIRAKHGEITDAVSLTVQRSQMTGFDVLADKTKVVVGNTVKVSAIIQPLDYPNQSVTWSSSDEEIAAVNSEGIVTATGTGMVTIRGIANDNKNFFDEVTIQVEDVKAEKVTITGNDKAFLIAGVGTLDLEAAIEPETAKDKEIEWSVSDTRIATVNENGHVVAVSQGEATIRAENPLSGVYDEIIVKVYDSAPLDLNIQVWVTNLHQNANVGIHIPADGTPIDPHAVMSEIFADGDKNYKFTGVIRYNDLAGDQPRWEELQKKDVVKKLRYNTRYRYVEYSTADHPGENGWKRVEQNLNGRLCAFYELLRGATNDGSDVHIVIGDWPYGENEGSGQNNQTIQVKVINDDTGNEIYDSGVMRYDNNCDGYYGKIKFECDTSRYEVDYATLQNGDGTPERINAADISAEGISVLFQSGRTNRYVIAAHVKAKEFRVSYDANGGTGSVPTAEYSKAVNGQTVTVAANPLPTRQDYVFAGWEYDGTTYAGGEIFEMPPNDIVFKAKWIQASKVINYVVHDKTMGTVSNLMDIIKSDTTSVQGSVANAKAGCRFIGWFENGQLVTDKNIFKPEGSQIKATTYEARFEASVYTITAEAINGRISPGGEQKVYYGKSLEINYNANPGYVLESVIVDGKNVSVHKDSYTFVNVADNHRIVVTYKRDTSGFEVAGVDREYNGEKVGVSSIGTLLHGEQWQYSEDGEQWQDSNYEYVNVTARDADAQGTPVYARVISGDTVLWDNDSIPAYVRITPKKVTVTADAAEKLFGRKDPVFTAEAEGTLGNDRVSYEVSRPGAGTEEKVGVYPGAIAAEGEEEQGNYEVSFIAADFTIKTNTEDLTLTAEDGGGEYNANAYKLKNIRTSLPDAVIEYQAGEGEWTTEEPRVTNVADSQDRTLRIRASLDGYTSAEISGLSIKVTQKPVMVTAVPAAKQFHTADPVFRATVDGNLNEDPIVYKVSRPGAGTEEEVGTYPNAIKAEGETNQGNYRVTYQDADFTISTNEVALTLTAEDGGGEYNANAYKLKNVAASFADATIEYQVGEGQWTTEEPRVTNAADSQHETIRVRASLDGYRTVTLENLSIIVTRKPVTVTADTAEKMFGREDPVFTAKAEGTLGNDRVSYEVSRPGAGTEEKVGVYPGAIAAEGEEEQGNYEVSFIAAGFTIKTNTEDLQLTAEDGGGKYTANPYKLKNVKASLPDAAIEYQVGEGEWTAEEPCVTNVADSQHETIRVRASLHGYQTVTLENLSILIEPRRVHLKSGDAFRAYNGEALTNPAISITGDGFILGEAIATAEGRITYVGETSNRIHIKEGTNYKKDNYFISKEEGLLTVTDGNGENPVDPDDVVVKTHEEKEYGLGTPIEFVIKVTNIYNTPKTILISEQPGVAITGKTEFLHVQPGDTITTRAVYTVKESDLIAGKFENTVKASFAGEKDFENTDTVAEFEEPNAELFIYKEATNKEDAPFEEGDEIQYAIHVKNAGNLTLTNVKITDPLTGDETQIHSLLPGAEQLAFNTSYEVTAADVMEGHVINETKTTAVSPDPKTEVKIWDDMVSNPTITPNPSLFVEKEAKADADGDGRYTLGEEISYTITVTNNGSVTMTDITVEDDLTGEAWTISSLAPKASRSFDTKYAVNTEDILTGTIVNNAKVSGTDPNGDSVESDASEIVRTDKMNTSYTVRKEIINPQEQYNVGDTIQYRITVASVEDVTNVTLNNIVVTDQLTGAAGEVKFTELQGAVLNPDNTVTITSLHAGESATLECEYTVVRADAGNRIVNTAFASPDPVTPTDPENPDPVDPGEEEASADPALAEDIYNLTIHYVYAAGGMAAPDVAAQYLAGESFSYTSPAIEGYTPSVGLLRSDRQGMPARDVEITIVYTAIPAVPTTVPVAPAAPTAPAPAAAAAPAPVAAAAPAIVVPVPDAPVPAAAVVADDEDRVDIVPVVEEEVPLTNRELDEHHCCFLHFLLMLAALIVFALYTGSMKKRQKRIAALTDELAMEAAKRKLGLADNRADTNL